MVLGQVVVPGLQDVERRACVPRPEGGAVGMSPADDATVLRAAAVVVTRRAPKPDAFLARLMGRILQRMADSVERLPG